LSHRKKHGIIYAASEKPRFLEHRIGAATPRNQYTKQAGLSKQQSHAWIVDIFIQFHGKIGLVPLARNQPIINSVGANPLVCPSQ
jgi:hypothetical protein